jgi:hypothetical protein
VSADPHETLELSLPSSVAPASVPAAARSTARADALEKAAKACAAALLSWVQVLLAPELSAEAVRGVVATARQGHAAVRRLRAEAQAARAVADEMYDIGIEAALRS